MTTTSLAAHFHAWAIVQESGAYDVRRLPVERLGDASVVAVHPSEASAENAMKRVRLFTGIRLPEWTASDSREAEFRETIARVVREIAMPVPERDDPAMPTPCS
jgi:hypothetical protein